MLKEIIQRIFIKVCKNCKLIFILEILDYTRKEWILMFLSDILKIEYTNKKLKNKRKGILVKRIKLLEKLSEMTTDISFS